MSEKISTQLPVRSQYRVKIPEYLVNSTGLRIGDVVEVVITVRKEE